MERTRGAGSRGREAKGSRSSYLPRHTYILRGPEGREVAEALPQLLPRPARLGHVARGQHGSLALHLEAPP